MNKHFFRISGLLVYPLLLAIMVITFIHGCNKGKGGEGEVVATINKEPLKLEDFQREMALRSRQDPSYKITPQAVEEQMDTVIDRRLMIQEAMKMGLASNKDFVRTIQTFWEQTLIRELIEAKNKEWEKRLFVTEQEVRDYYENMRNTAKKDNADVPALQTLYDQIKRDILQQKRTTALESWLKEVRDKAVIEVNENLLDASFKNENMAGHGNNSGHRGDRNVR